MSLHTDCSSSLAPHRMNVSLRAPSTSASVAACLASDGDDIIADFLCPVQIHRSSYNV